MLLNLNILDLAVVKSLDLDLEKGMSVLTGETGAGKSILLTALGLALGDRADSGYVRPDSKRAEINLEFDLDDAPSARDWLAENELDDGDRCLIRRVVSEDGRSKAYINNRPVTLQSLQELSEKLVEIHGQHAHLTLLGADEQRRLLDAFAKSQPLLDRLNACYRQWHQAHRELAALKKASLDHSEREELLRYQLDELAQLDLAHFDYQALSDEHNKLANLGHILSSGQQQLDVLYENDQVSVLRMLGHCVNELNHLARFAPELNGVCSLLAEAQIQIEEAALDLRRFLELQEADPKRLEELENRIGMIQNLSRKHHVAPEDLPELAQKLAHELDNLTHSEERLGELEADVAKYLEQYRQLAVELTEMRCEGAARLGQQISAMIKELGMPQGEFRVELTESDSREPKPNGLDKIEFLVSANPGMPPKPLAKVASGGELARISLAIQVTTSSDKTTPTMIFDEVDSGIGGGIAEIVGQKLRSLSRDRQVMCVTHLPQVAAQAHHHLFVAKNQQTDLTSSTVRMLDGEERILEVARMLGGVNITENTLAHAREMLTLGNSQP
ncbi:DNA repair protein RecN [Candidatus Methylomicrobium oryzae]|jgi:DNA repair protein RecN (Recombination protein N)|uniref:DNA repair protein RecN n=1 Tax=Candidatus Methylomicrobium oryzae TaxID=2802053 RepID=UPI0019219E25|nr:DNA repair protein RecN [Methylomicrobium sp. RS1]MBL1264171.1 DNA repair protein RecN [Methylomicrobium sp. RS1]